MSRTFRLRHLPVLEGYARKYVDAPARFNNRIIDCRVDSYYAHVLYDFPCKVGGPEVIGVGFDCSHWRCSHNMGWRNWRYEPKLRQALGLSYPVSSTCNHPWVRSQWVKNGHKTWECKRGHRAGRRHDKKLLNRFLGSGSQDELWDDFKPAFSHPRYFIDPWSWD